MIAADANNSGSVTSFDIVTIRKVILGMPGAVLTAGSWRYVPKLCTETTAFINQFYDGNPFDADYTDPFQGFTRHYKSAGNNIPNADSWMDHLSLVTTSGISHEENTWSFTGVKVGDVNCSVYIDGFAPEPGDDEFAVQSGSNTGISSGAIKKIKILASVTTDVTAWQFGIRFASDSLSILAIQPGNTGTTFDVDNFYHSSPTEPGNNNGALKSIWFAQDGNAVSLDGKVLYELIVEANQNIGNLLDIFKLDTRALDMKFYNAQGQAIPNVALMLSLENTTFERSKVNRTTSDTEFQVTAYPVPFDSEINFEFMLPGEESVDISLFDATGKLVSELKIVLPAGDHQLHLPSLKDCAPGLYWYSLKAGRYSAFNKIIKN